MPKISKICQCPPLEEPNVTKSSSTKCQCHPKEEPVKLKNSIKKQPFFINDKKRNGLDDGDLGVLSKVIPAEEYKFKKQYSFDTIKETSSSSEKESDTNEGKHISNAQQCNLPGVLFHKPIGLEAAGGKHDVQIVVQPEIDVKEVDASERCSHKAWAGSCRLCKICNPYPLPKNATPPQNKSCNLGSVRVTSVPFEEAQPSQIEPSCSFVCSSPQYAVRHEYSAASRKSANPQSSFAPSYSTLDQQKSSLPIRNALPHCSASYLPVSSPSTCPVSTGYQPFKLPQKSSIFSTCPSISVPNDGSPRQLPVRCPSPTPSRTPNQLLKNSTPSYVSVSPSGSPSQLPTRSRSFLRNLSPCLYKRLTKYPSAELSSARYPSPCQLPYSSVSAEYNSQPRYAASSSNYLSGNNRQMIPSKCMSSYSAGSPWPAFGQPRFEYKCEPCPPCEPYPPSSYQYQTSPGNSKCKKPNFIKRLFSKKL